MTAELPNRERNPVSARVLNTCRQIASVLLDSHRNGINPGVLRLCERDRDRAS